MDYIVSKLFMLIGDKKAVTALEYGMIAALIAVVCIGVIGGVGTKVSYAFSSVSSAL